MGWLKQMILGWSTDCSVDLGFDAPKSKCLDVCVCFPQNNGRNGQMDGEMVSMYVIQYME